MDVNTRNRADLKAFFVKNSIPTQSNFADLIDGMLNQKDDGFVKAKNLPLSIEAADPGVADSEKKAVSIYQSFADPNPAWTLSLNPRTTPSDPKTAKLGFAISVGEGTNRLFIDRDSGNVGIGTTAPKGKLEVTTGGAGAWNKLVVNTTNLWGDGNTQYVTIGEGGASGIMFYNPHVVWYAPENRASIRMGRSGGVASGHWWDIGVRAGNMFSIVDGQNGVTGLTISEAGNVGLGTTNPAAKLHVIGPMMEQLDIIRTGQRGDWNSTTHPIKVYFHNKLSGKPKGTFLRALTDQATWQGHYWNAWVDNNNEVRIAHNHYNTLATTTNNSGIQ